MFVPQVATFSISFSAVSLYRGLYTIRRRAIASRRGRAAVGIMEIPTGIPVNIDMGTRTVVTGQL